MSESLKAIRDARLSTICAGYLVFLDAVNALQCQMFAEDMDAEKLAKVFDIVRRACDKLQGEFAETETKEAGV